MMRVPLAILAVALVGSSAGASAEPASPNPAGGPPITFTRDIAPLVWRHCANCHRPGQAAPFNLLTYQDLRKRGRQIVEVVTNRFMPPWLPEPGFGKFLDDRSLSREEIGALRRWLEEGAVEGVAADLPPAPVWTEGWRLGPPDLIVQMPEPYTLPAEGRDVYRNFVMPIPTVGRRYVQAVELQPGNAKILHHAFLRLDRTPQSRLLDEREPGPGFGGLHTPGTAQTPDGQFLSWQPGKIPTRDAAGLAWALQPKTDLILQAHLQPSGKPERLQAAVGFYFTNQTPTNTPAKFGIRSFDIDIPAGATNHLVEETYQLPVDLDVLALLPHAHYLGREVQGFAVLPDGTKQWLLLIKQWNFNWQGEYRCAQPVPLPKGSTVHMRWFYDNSTNNARNPNQPPRRVRYGVQATDEMAELWLQVLPRGSNDLAALARDYGVRVMREAVAYNEYLLGLDPNDAKAHAELGKVKLAQGQGTEALRHLQTALRIDSGSEDAHYYLGLLAQRYRRLDQAKIEFEQVILLNPQNFKAHNNLGLVLLDLGEYDQAEARFRAALMINPGDEVAQSNLELTLKTKADRARTGR